MGKFITSDGSRLTEMKDVLSTILELFKNIMTSKRFNEKKVYELQTMLKLFYSSILDVNFHRQWRIELLTEMLTAIIVIPTENAIPRKRTLAVYEQLNLMNIVTFLIFQTRQIKFSKTLISVFLEYMQGDDEYNYYALLLYRVNPQYVKETVCLDISDATPKELYFGISTGYFPYMEGTKESYERLVEMVRANNSDNSNYNPAAVLKLLKKDGFISKETFLALISML